MKRKLIIQETIDLEGNDPDLKVSQNLKIDLLIDRKKEMAEESAEKEGGVEKENTTKKKSPYRGRSYSRSGDYGRNRNYSRETYRGKDQKTSYESVNLVYKETGDDAEVASANNAERMIVESGTTKTVEGAKWMDTYMD